MTDFARWWQENVPRSQGALTVDHPHWEEFLDRLSGPGYLEAEWDTLKGDWRWTCPGRPGRSDLADDRPLTRRLLGEMGFTDEEIEVSLDYFTDHGGCCCDCEVWMNVENMAKKLDG